MRAAEIRDQLLAQHENLRVLLHRARGAIDLAELMPIIRQAFEEHNRFEEAILRPLLALTGDWGQARIDRMVAEHHEEHGVFLSFFARPIAELTQELDDFIEEVEAHMAAEERVFLNAAILRDREP